MDAPEGFVRTRQMGFSEHIGPLYRKGDDPAEFVFAARIADHHINRGGVVHGGMLMSFADHCLGETVHATTNARCSTISLQVNFVAPGRIGDWIFCKGEVTRVTRSVVFIRGRVFAGEQTLVDIQGVWKLLSGG
jgi:uncharacterized protein (TIGR00369 family)